MYKIIYLQKYYLFDYDNVLVKTYKSSLLKVESKIGLNQSVLCWLKQADRSRTHGVTM